MMNLFYKPLNQWSFRLFTSTLKKQEIVYHSWHVRLNSGLFMIGVGCLKLRIIGLPENFSPVLHNISSKPIFLASWHLSVYYSLTDSVLISVFVSEFFIGLSSMKCRLLSGFSLQQKFSPKSFLAWNLLTGFHWWVERCLQIFDKSRQSDIFAQNLLVTWYAGTARSIPCNLGFTGNRQCPWLCISSGVWHYRAVPFKKYTVAWWHNYQNVGLKIEEY